MRTRLFVTLLLGFAYMAIPVAGQTTTYTPGVTYQSANPNYPPRNPFYFEGRVDWNLLKITDPSNPWEFAQRGIHKQDDLEDNAGAIADYQTAIAGNNLTNGTCQLISSTTVLNASTNPPPCMFTVRLRLANLLKSTNPQQAIELFNEVLTIDPLRLGVNAMIGDVYTTLAQQATDPAASQGFYASALKSYSAELALSPVTPLTISLSGDEANNAHVHWSMAEIYRTLGDQQDEASQLNLYLKATKWHSDTYAWHITLAERRLLRIQTKRTLK